MRQRINQFIADDDNWELVKAGFLCYVVIQLIVIGTVLGTDAPLSVMAIPFLFVFIGGSIALFFVAGNFFMNKVRNWMLNDDRLD